MKPIPGYLGYFITKDGKLFSTIKGAVKPIRTQTNMTGYILFRPWVNQKRKNLFLHKALLLTFVGPPPIGKPYVDHIDGDKRNNSLSNLRWVSGSENSLNTFRLGRRKNGEGGSKAKLTWEQVREMRRLRKKQPELSNRQIAELYSIGTSTAGFILTGRTWKEHE